RWFFLGLGIASAVGTALIYWAGGHLVLGGSITVGTIVAFAAYLTRLYGPISSLTNVQVEFATSMVSFERVFEYTDLPVEIENRPDAVELKNVRGRVRFEDVSFSYLEPDQAPVAEPEDDEDDGDDGETGAVPGEVVSRRWALQDLTFE